MRIANVNFRVEAILIWLPEGIEATPERFEGAVALPDTENHPRAFDYAGRAVARAVKSSNPGMAPWIRTSAGIFDRRGILELKGRGRPTPFAVAPPEFAKAA